MVQILCTAYVNGDPVHRETVFGDTNREAWGATLEWHAKVIRMIQAQFRDRIHDLKTQRFEIKEVHPGDEMALWSLLPDELPDGYRYDGDDEF